MLQSKLIGETKKEWPNEATLKSHGLLLKGGYIKQMASGIFTLMPLGKRVISKIENIIREEMNAIGAQEIFMPLVATKKLWDMSGRYDTIGSELLRFKDRTGTDMVLSMTHEEATVFSVMNEALSYQKYPFSVYQIQTKFRDEARSRGGLIRVREFTMKDAYSFHENYESLDEVYNNYYEAYNRIYTRVGIPEVVAVASDTGMMGGSGAHEYMLLCDAGEDKIVVCNNCKYSANMEVAYTKKYDSATCEIKNLEKIYTPNIKTIEELSNFTNISKEKMIKAVIYQRLDTNENVIVFIRADREVNETKLRNLLKVDDEKLVPKKEEENDGICYGYVGVINLKTTNNTKVLYDISLKDETCLVTGANEENYHYTGVNLLRDVKDIKFYDLNKITDNDYCPMCGKKAITISNGIEVGNIFKLGDKYTKAMKMTYIDENGETKNPIMGCYGIGIGRLMASCLEARATQKCVNWSREIAPFDIHICPLDYNKNEEITEFSNILYKNLSDKGYEVLLDDREKSAGVKFADADLIGAPIRIVIGKKNYAQNMVEVKIESNESTLIEVEKIYDYIENNTKGWKK